MDRTEAKGPKKGEAHHVGYFGDSAVLQHGLGKADRVLRNNAALFRRLLSGFQIDPRRRKERVDDTRAKRRIRQGEPAKEKRHELGDVLAKRVSTPRSLATGSKSTHRWQFMRVRGPRYHLDERCECNEVRSPP